MFLYLVAGLADTFLALMIVVGCTCTDVYVFLTEVRQEAVQQALAAMQNRPKPSLPMPSKRTSVMAKSPDRDHHDSGKSNKVLSCVQAVKVPCGQSLIIYYTKNGPFIYRLSGKLMSG